MDYLSSQIICYFLIFDFEQIKLRKKMVKYDPVGMLGIMFKNKNYF